MQDYFEENLGKFRQFLDSLKKERPRIALDADEVLDAVMPLVVEHINMQNKKDYDPYNIQEYPSKERGFLGLKIEEVDELFDYIWLNEAHKIRKIAYEDPIIEAKKFYDINVVTTKGERIRKKFEEWLNSNFPKARLEVLTLQKHADKSELDFDIYIDDAPRLINKISENKKKFLFLVSYPYNRHGEISNVADVKNLEEAMKILVDAINERGK